MPSIGTFDNQGERGFVSPDKGEMIDWVLVLDLQPFNTGTDMNSPMPAAEVVARTALPPGFRMTVFAAEPDVQQPNATATDALGRAHGELFFSNTVIGHPWHAIPGAHSPGNRAPAA